MTAAETDKRAEMPKPRSGDSGRYPSGPARGVSKATARQEHPHRKASGLMEAVVERENMARAYRRVVGNHGAAGVDAMPVEALLPYLKEHWVGIKEELLTGRYQPQPIRIVEIPKPGGGLRMLGIPTCVDRLVQQALHQVLTPVFQISRNRATASVLVVAPTRPCTLHGLTWSKAGGGS